MSYVAIAPEKFFGKVIGDGECAVFVEKAISNMPLTRCWCPGIQVKGNLSIPRGTAIATFQNTQYSNKAGESHAAIYLYQDNLGIWVLDQWKNRNGFQPVHKRRIFFDDKNSALVVNHGEDYFVIESKC